MSSRLSFRSLLGVSVVALGLLAGPLVAHPIVGMGPCEARGYIRGRAGREIRRQARLAVSRHIGVDAAAVAAIVARASDRVPSLVLRRLTAAFQRVGATQRQAA